MLNKQDYRELLLQLKIHFGVNSNKELAEKLGLSEDGIKNWTRKKEIPTRYTKILEKNDTNKKSNINAGSVQINGNNHGHININSSDEMSMEICKEIKKLSDVKKEYFYHLIKAEVLKEKL